MNMSKIDPKGSFVRWQIITLTQLTYAINLFISLSVAALGFEITLLLNEKFNPIGWQKCVYFFSYVFIGFALIFGIVAVINRLIDFRYTTKVARKREKLESGETKEQEKQEVEMKIERYRELCEKLGKRTWVLFWCQVGTFSAGMLFASVSVLAPVSNKLF